MSLVLALLLAGCGPRHLYPDGRGLQGQLEREVQALQQRVRVLEGEVATCSEGTSDPLYTDLVQILKGSEVEIERIGSATVLTVPLSHLFAPGNLVVREEATATLDLVATALAIHRDYTLLVEGHTDDAALSQAVKAKYPSAWELTFAYARAVQEAMVYKLGVSEGRFTVAGRGSTRPRATNDTPGGRERNRRVVIWLYPPGAR